MDSRSKRIEIRNYKVCISVCITLHPYYCPVFELEKLRDTLPKIDGLLVLKLIFVSLVNSSHFDLQHLHLSFKISLPRPMLQGYFFYPT